MEQSGIYIARSGLDPEKAFIFPAIEGDMCWQRHLESLKGGHHYIKKLQDHFKENPGDEFEVRLLRPCHKSEFLRLQEHFIKRYKPFFNMKGKSKTNENK